jgi:hypothetical protein
VFGIYSETKKKASDSKEAKLEEVKKSSRDEILKIDEEYNPNIDGKEAEIEKIKERVTQAQTLLDSSRTLRYNARVAFDKLKKKYKDDETDSPEYKSALALKESTEKDVTTAELALTNASKELEAARKILSQIMREQTGITQQIKQNEQSETTTINEAWVDEKEKALQVATNAISSEKSTINAIHIKVRKISYYYFQGMGITIGTDNQVKFDEKNAEFIKNYKPLIESYPNFDELLKKIVSIIYVIKSKAESLNTDLEFREHKMTLGHLSSTESNIDKLPPLIQTFSKLIQEFNGVLFKYKNAFVTLAFKIVTTLFGYGISILQIFMQNFPEQLSFFTEKESPLLSPPPKIPKKPTEDYGLNQLNALKKPVEPFVKEYIENQDITLDQYTYEPKPTEFSLLTPTLDLTKVPLFRLPDIPVMPVMPTGGGKKQRRLLLPPPSRPLQSNKRPKKRKTIKKRSSATTSTSKTTKKNKRYTNNKNNNKTKKNKPMKSISTKSNQKRNKKHKRSIRKV